VKGEKGKGKRFKKLKISVRVFRGQKKYSPNSRKLLTGQAIFNNKIFNNLSVLACPVSAAGGSYLTGVSSWLVAIDHFLNNNFDSFFLVLSF